MSRNKDNFPPFIYKYIQYIPIYCIFWLFRNLRHAKSNYNGHNFALLFQMHTFIRIVYYMTVVHNKTLDFLVLHFNFQLLWILVRDMTIIYQLAIFVILPLGA